MARFNIAVKHMMRNKRQEQGKLPQQPYYPALPLYEQPELQSDYPASYEGVLDLPLTFAYVRRGELSGDSGEQQGRGRQNTWQPPAYDTVELVELPTSFKPDTELDPIPQSNEFADDNKIRPWAHIRVPGYLAVSEWEGVDNSDFDNGWLLNKGEFRQHVPQYVGQHHPIDVNPLIPEVEYTTYGALNQLSPGQVAQMPVSDGYLFD